MLRELKNELLSARTENGGAAYSTTMSDCLDLFSTIGALRAAPEQEIRHRFLRAWAENPSLALRIAFYARDVRGGLGERRAFRIILRCLANLAPATLKKNLVNIPEYGRFDDLMALLDTSCQKEMFAFIGEQLAQDLSALEQEGTVSLLAKWLPSVNASNPQTVAQAKRVARALHMDDRTYRKTLSTLRQRIALLENNLRERNYTFDYSKQPSKAMFKYRRAFIRSDGERYRAFLKEVQAGEATLHTGTLYPYELVNAVLQREQDSQERQVLDTTWKALPDYAAANNGNALVVVDGSGSMYWSGMQPTPISVALSLGLYMAQRTTGAFHNHFITFSHRPKLVEVKGQDLYEQVRYCASFSEAANTDLQAVFNLLLKTAVHNGLKQEDLPETLYIISDMEFDACAEHADQTCFHEAQAAFRRRGYRLPNVVFWNVASRTLQQPVTMNEQGVALVSGCSPRVFEMVLGGTLSPYDYMLEILNGPRYRDLAV